MNAPSVQNTGLDDLLVGALAGDSSGYIYAGTLLGGMFRSILPVTSVTVGPSGLPTEFALEQNYPNPFNPTTGIRYHLPASGQAGVPGASDVKLVVYDMLGREVAVLVNEKKAPGAYEVKFDASGLASGVYLYRLQAGDFVQTHKLILLK